MKNPVFSHEIFMGTGLGQSSSEVAAEVMTKHIDANYVCIPKEFWENAQKVYGDKTATKWSVEPKKAELIGRLFDVRKIPFDVKDWKKGMYVRINGGDDLWTVLEDGKEDDILLVNGEGVVIGCDYRRIRFIEMPK